MSARIRALCNPTGRAKRSYITTQFDDSLYVDHQQQPQLWAAVLVYIGRSNRELGSRSEGEAIQNSLDASVNAYRHALEVRTREELPQQWAATQNNLGAALRNQGTRTGGTEGAGL